jgi:outer membrane protein OmpA-like peptidoglycan-associated protein
VILFASPNITSAGQAAIQAAADQYQSLGSVSLQIIGYADVSTSEAFNVRLSERRAMAIAAILERLGVRRSDMSVVGKGASNPPLNDRVEIVFP